MSSSEPPRFRLVIIDDNRSDLVLLHEAIADSGHAIEVLAFTNALLALATLANETRVDLILSDINMPLMNGLELATRMRAIPRMKDVGIVLMSSGIDLDMPASCVASAVMSPTSVKAAPGETTGRSSMRCTVV